MTDHLQRGFYFQYENYHGLYQVLRIKFNSIYENCIMQK